MLPLPCARPFWIASSTSAFGGSSWSRFGPTSPPRRRPSACGTGDRTRRTARWPCFSTLRELRHAGLRDRVAVLVRREHGERDQRRRAPAGRARTAGSRRRCRGGSSPGAARARPAGRRGSPGRPGPSATTTQKSTKARTAIGAGTLPFRAARYGMSAGAGDRTPHGAARGLIGAAPRRSSARRARRRGSRPARRRRAPRPPAATRRRDALRGTVGGDGLRLRALRQRHDVGAAAPGAASGAMVAHETLIAPPATGSFSSRPRASSSGSERTTSRCRS